MRLDQYVFRLLHDPDLRVQLADGGLRGVAPEINAALASIDLEQLEATARRMRARLLRRSHRGAGGLLDIYADTLGELDGQALDALMARFMLSEAYAGYREIPFAGAGTSLEEAFYRFAHEDGLGDAERLERAFYRGMVSALLVCPEPSFTMPAEARRVRDGWAFVLRPKTGPPELFAALTGRKLEGEITPSIADAITGAATLVRSAGLAPLVDRLEALGLTPVNGAAANAAPPPAPTAARRPGARRAKPDERHLSTA